MVDGNSRFETRDNSCLKCTEGEKRTRIRDKEIEKEREQERERKIWS